MAELTDVHEKEGLLKVSLLRHFVPGRSLYSRVRGGLGTDKNPVHSHARCSVDNV